LTNISSKLKGKSGKWKVEAVSKVTFNKKSGKVAQKCPNASSATIEVQQLGAYETPPFS